MAILSTRTIVQLSATALLPVSADDGNIALATAQRFPSSGSFSPGDGIVVASDAAFCVLAGDATVTATTSSPRFQAGVYKFTMPDGATNVSMIDATSSAAGHGQAYKG